MYHVNNVVGSDEYAQNIDDDAFTNGMAKKSLEIANKARALLNITENAEWKKIA